MSYHLPQRYLNALSYHRSFLCYKCTNFMIIPYHLDRNIITPQITPVEYGFTNIIVAVNLPTIALSDYFQKPSHLLGVVIRNHLPFLSGLPCLIYHNTHKFGTHDFIQYFTAIRLLYVVYLKSSSSVYLNL